MVTPSIMLLCALRKPVITNLDSNQTPREVEEVLIEGEVLDVADVVDVVVVGEEQSSKMTADRSLNLKVGRMLSHLPHSLLIPNPKTLLHFRTLVRHIHLNILQTVEKISHARIHGSRLFHEFLLKVLATMWPFFPFFK